MTLRYSQSLRLVSRATEQLQTHQFPPKAVSARQLYLSALLSSTTTRQWTSRRTITTRTANSHTTRPVPEPSIRPQQPEGTQTEPPLALSHHVRLLMRHVPHPVAIITSTDPSVSADRASKGMTVSSFNTVTLYPEPVVSFNVKRPSETLNALTRSGRFLVHLLAPTKAAAKLARDFSRGNTNLAIGKGSPLGEFEFVSYSPPSGGEAEAEVRSRYDHDDTSDVVASRTDNIPLPILRKRGANAEHTTPAKEDEDFLFVLECTYLPQEINVHDHTIVLGTVVRTIRQSESLLKQVEGSEETRSTSSLSLMYADTRFWNMGTEL